jgi:UrcA family protein
MWFKNSPLSDWRRTGFISALLLASMFASSVALAVEQAMEEVHAHVQRPAEAIVGWTFTGMPMKKMTSQYHVRYDDLDLASNEGADILRTRITHAARHACADLGKGFRMLGPDRSCITAARKSARSQVDHAIARARSGE